MKTEKTGDKCTSCKIGDVLKETTRECMVPIMNRIIGPGGKGQWKEVVQYHCGSCGIMFRFPPSEGSAPSEES